MHTFWGWRSNSVCVKIVRFLHLIIVFAGKWSKLCHRCLKLFLDQLSSSNFAQTLFMCDHAIPYENYTSIYVLTVFIAMVKSSSSIIRLFFAKLWSSNFTSKLRRQFFVGNYIMRCNMPLNEKQNTLFNFFTHR